MQEQWIIATVMEGEAPENFVGPFPTKKAAQDWAEANDLYLASMVESVLDNWMGDPGEIAPTVHHMVWFMNAPQDVERGMEEQRAEMED